MCMNVIFAVELVWICVNEKKGSKNVQIWKRKDFQSPESLSTRITKLWFNLFFCILKTLMALDELPQNMIPLNNVCTAWNALISLDRCEAATQD